jgi:YD repeat-containing protein
MRRSIVLLATAVVLGGCTLASELTAETCPPGRRLLPQQAIDDVDFVQVDGITYDAAFLDPGTPLHAVRGYRTSFRLAAHRDGRLVLYEVFENPQARTWGDLLDLDGKVARVAIDNRNLTLAFSLEDGTATSLAYDLASRRPECRAPLPRAFGAPIEGALR